MNPILTEYSVVKDEVRNILSEVTTKDLVIYSEKAIEKTDIRPKERWRNYKDIGIDIDNINSFINKNKHIERVISFGTGRATDIGKYIANQLNVELISIPSLLSVNVFFTDKSCLVKNSCKITVNTKVPDKIIFDQGFIANCLYTDNLNGFSEIMSIHTALFDWKLADIRGIEPIDEYIYWLCQESLFFLLANRERILEDHEFGLNTLFRMLVFTGFITNIYGSGRPESASEHIFSKLIEEKVDIKHGLSVALGIIVVSELQDNISAPILDFIQRSGILADTALISRELIINIIQDLIPRNDRYTILDEVVMTKEKASLIVNKMEKVYGIQFKK